MALNVIIFPLLSAASRTGLVVKHVKVRHYDRALSQADAGLLPLAGAFWSAELPRHLARSASSVLLQHCGEQSAGG